MVSDRVATEHVYFIFHIALLSGFFRILAASEIGDVADHLDVCTLDASDRICQNDADDMSMLQTALGSFPHGQAEDRISENSMVLRGDDVSSRSNTLKQHSDILWLPFGDSITYGCGSDTTFGHITCADDDSGYRGSLAMALTAQGHDITTMGTQTTGPKYLPAKWLFHEGHPGWRIDQVAKMLDASLATSARSPDLITIHLGTNDCGQNKNIDALTIINRMVSLLSDMFAKVPTAHVFLASIIAEGGPKWKAENHKRFNGALPGLVRQFKDKGMLIYYVPMAEWTGGMCVRDHADPLSGLCEPGNVHPTAAGYLRMASAFSLSIMNSRIFETARTDKHPTQSMESRPFETAQTDKHRIIESFGERNDSASNSLHEIGAAGEHNTAEEKVVPQYHQPLKPYYTAKYESPRYGFALLLFTVACICYEIHQCSAKSPSSPSIIGEAVASDTSGSGNRSSDFDIMKLFLIYWVIHFHLFYFDTNSFRPVEREWVFFGASFCLSGFALISGILGRSLKAMSFARTICHTVGTSLLFVTVFNTMKNGVPVDFYQHSYFPDQAIYVDYNYQTTWYLQAVLLWKLSMAPLQYAVGSNSIAKYTCFAVLCLAIYFILALFPVSIGPYKNHIFLLAFYACGVFAPVETLMKKAGDSLPFALISTFCVVVWFACAFLFQDWICLDLVMFSSEAGDDFTSPSSIADMKKVDFRTFVNFIRVGSLKLFITVAILCSLAYFSASLSKHAPSVREVLSKCGTRSLHGYLLHWALFVDLADATCTYEQVAQAMPRWSLYIFFWILPVVATFVVTSSLTGLLFDWMMRPYWLLDVVFWIFRPAGDAAAAATALVVRQQHSPKSTTSS